jgi:hypothetical protein
LTHAQKYHPAAPPRAARRKQVLRHALGLPKSLWAIYKIVREDFSAAVLDECLWAFWGFHQEVLDGKPWDPHCRMRTWDKAQLSSITPQEVVGGLAVWEMAFMLNFAMENEDPIFEYTQQSGEGFRFLLPTLGRFMGKNHEQAGYSAEHNLPWCESAWCAEERRHSNAFARIIERLVGTSPLRENPNQPMAVTADEADAVQHMINRQASEWNAASSYVVMTVHAAGDLRILLRNIARDEIKHLAILSSADSYLFGPRPWARLFAMVRLGLENYHQQRKMRSGGDILGGNPALSLEGIVSHVLTALFLTKWLKTVPLRTLATVFETASKLPELAALTPSPERQAQITEVLRKGREKRMALARWKAGPRSNALQQRGLEEANAGAIQEFVAAELGGFRGAEVPGSAGEKHMKELIADCNNKQLRACLLDRLRDYQIHNNRHVMARQPRPLRANHSNQTACELAPATSH